LMKKIFFLIPLFFLGCADKTGFTLRYYDECYGEYDYYGVYKEVCPHNLIDYKTIKELPHKIKIDNKDNQCLQCN